MAKKKSSKMTVNLLVGVLGLLFGVAALCMGFLSGAAFNGGEYDMATVFQMAFGWKEDVAGATISLSGFNIWITLGLFFPIIGGLLLLLKGKFSALIALVLYVVAAVLFFTALSSFTNTLFTLEGAGLDNIIGATAAEAIRALIKNGNASLGIGAILGGIFSILGALAAAYKTFLMK